MLDLVHQLALTLPLSTELGFLLLEFSDISVELFQFTSRTSLTSLTRLFPFDALALDFELSQTTGNLVEFLWD